MRPKFRGRYESEKLMLPIAEITFHKNGDILAFPLSREAISSYLVGGNVVLMQFTGLFDKNGKEIYEGDIVSDGVHSYEMIWCEGLYGWMYDDTYSGNLFLPSEISGEIIGNIHENPELIDRYTIHC